MHKTWPAVSSGVETIVRITQIALKIIDMRDSNTVKIIVVQTSRAAGETDSGSAGQCHTAPRWPLALNTT